MAARFSEMAVAVLVGCALVWMALNVWMALTLLVDKGIFVPVAVPVIVPAALVAKVKKAGAALMPAPAKV